MNVRSTKHGLAWALVACALCLAGEARAAADGEPAWEKAPSVRRAGFSAGLSLGLGVGSFAGYPNDVRKIGYERYYTETGAAPGSATELWIAGALTDWFTFGIGFGVVGMASSDDLKAAAGTFTFRMEGYPLFNYGGRLQDLGVLVETGTGSVMVTPADDEDTKLIDGGAASRVGVGLFYEGARPWKLGMGPFVSFDYFWSDTVRSPVAVVGFRSAIYAGN